VLPTILFVTADWPTGIAFSITAERFARVVPVRTVFDGVQALAERIFGLVIVDQSRTDDDLRPLLKAARARNCDVLVVSGCERAANALASHLGRSPELRSPSRCVGQAIDEIRANYREPLTVGAIASAIHVSPSHLAHRFRAETGMTVKEYVSRMRVEMAGRMLRETDAKLESIADAVGFCDAPHLSRVFVQYTRQRPGEYRRRPA
jgi:transcriptional regulator GlxA family with amidase domain